MVESRAVPEAFAPNWKHAEDAMIPAERGVRERLSRDEAQSLISEFGENASTIPERVARARSWLVLELFELAWNELTSVERIVPAGRLRARVRADLFILSYYLARAVDEQRWAEAIEAEAETEPAILADLHLGLALRSAARNDLHQALRHVHFGLDLAGTMKERHPRESLPLLRTKAHLLAQAACYRDALATCEAAAARALALSDPWETGRCEYSRGFVLWSQGRPVEAIIEFDRALAHTEFAGSSLPRWIRCCRARALAMLGRVDEAETDLAESSHRLPDDLAYLAIARGQPEVAAAILAAHVADPDPFVYALRGIAQTLLGAVADAERSLISAEAAFEAGGLTHFALATEIHLAYCKDQKRRGAGRAIVRRAVASLMSRGAHSFAWPHPSVVSWVRRAVADDPRSASFAGNVLEEGHRVPVAVRLRELGLTRRESEILLYMSLRSGQGTLTRKALAAGLEISANTLRVHIMRMRSKLEVRTRGDGALIAALCDAIGDVTGDVPSAGRR